MNQNEKANLFRSLHIPGNPIVLYNAWDAGSAQAIARAGAAAVATSSWSVAAAQGYEDGQFIPFELLNTILSRVAAAIDLPLTVDFEGGYAEDPQTVAENISRLIAIGAIGINFEDGRSDGNGLYQITEQVKRIHAIKDSAIKEQVPLFINARTDIFLKARKENHGRYLDEAKERVYAYAAAGASGIFVPGMIDEPLIEKFCAESPLPVNIMVMSGAPSIIRLANLGVARISFGPTPYLSAMESLEAKAREATRVAT